MKVNWFKSFDLLHTPMSLSYKNDYFYTTYIGAFLTILCIIIVISISSYEIKELVNKSSFSIISNQYSDISQSIDFSKRTLLFQLIDNTGEMMELDDKLYEFKAYDMEWIVEYDQDGKKNYKVINTELEIDHCDKVLTNNLEDLSELDLSKYICIKPEQNITSYGYLGDMNNGYKGFRIYLNKCNNKVDCYNETIILKRLQNIKFRVTYSSLNTNIFKIGTDNLDFQLYSKSCSVSTNLLKKFYFTFSIGRFHLYNNIFFKRRTLFNYIIGNDAIMDIDLDPSSTINKNSNTLAYFSFNFDGNVVEISKEIKRFFDVFSIIGNAFNIVLTIFKIINNYYSNKILFVDIFNSIFIGKEITHTNAKHSFSQINLFKNLNNHTNYNHHNHSNKNVLDYSEGFGLNYFVNSNNNVSNIHHSQIIKKPISKLINTIDKNKSSKKRISKIFTINKETKKNLKYYYLLPFCILKKNKEFDNICFIQEKICNYFSIEKINELIRFKDNIEKQSKKLKKNELIKVNKRYKDISDDFSNNKKKNN